MSAELLPCPFCGGEGAALIRVQNVGAPESRPVAWCPSCGARGICATTGEAAIELWNRRLGWAAVMAAGRKEGLKEAAEAHRKLGCAVFGDSPHPDPARDMAERIVGRLARLTTDERLRADGIIRAEFLPAEKGTKT